jgi:hypothetical protein
MSDAEAAEVFKQVRWHATGGEPVCPRCGCLGVYAFRTRHNEKNFIKLFCAHRGNSTTVLGLYALALKYESVDKLLSNEKHLVVDSRHFPAIFIRCLAVVRHLQCNGLGTFLLMDALQRAYHVSKNVAVFGVALTSLNGRTTELYQKYGFGVRDDDYNPTMILPIWSLWDLIEAADRNECRPLANQETPNVR